MDDPSELEALRRRVAVLEVQLEDRRREIEYWKAEMEAFANEMVAAQDTVTDLREWVESRPPPPLTQRQTNGSVDGVPLPDTRYANHVRNSIADEYALWVDAVIHTIRRERKTPERLSLRDIATELNKRKKDGKPRREPTDDYLPTPNGRTAADGPGWTHRQVARVMVRAEQALIKARQEEARLADARKKLKQRRRQKRTEPNHLLRLMAEVESQGNTGG